MTSPSSPLLAHQDVHRPAADVDSIHRLVEIAVGDEDLKQGRTDATCVPRLSVPLYERRSWVLAFQDVVHASASVKVLT